MSDLKLNPISSNNIKVTTSHLKNRNKTTTSTKTEETTAKTPIVTVETEKVDFKLTKISPSVYLKLNNLFASTSLNNNHSFEQVEGEKMVADCSFSLLHGYILKEPEFAENYIQITNSYPISRELILQFNQESETYITKQRKLLDSTVEVGIAVDSESLLLHESMLLNFIAFNLNRLEEYVVLVYCRQEADTCGEVLQCFKLNREFLKLYEQIQTAQLLNIDIGALKSNSILSKMRLQVQMNALSKSWVVNSLVSNLSYNYDFLNLSKLDSQAHMLKKLDKEVENYSHVLFKKGNYLKQLWDHKTVDDSDKDKAKDLEGEDPESIKVQLKSIDQANVVEKMMIGNQILNNKNIVEKKLNQLLNQKEFY